GRSGAGAGRAQPAGRPRRRARRRRGSSAPTPARPGRGRTRGGWASDGGEAACTDRNLSWVGGTERGESVTFFEELWFQIGASPAGALGVLIASAVLYLVFALILQIAGPRLSANPSMLSFAVMALLGSLVARAFLGNTPTLVGGLIAVSTLLMLEYLLGSLRPGLGRIFTRGGPRPTVVMVHGHVLRWQLRHLGLSEAQLLTLL